MTLLERIEEMYPDEPIVLANGFEEAFIGVATVFSKFIAVYDTMKCLDILVERDGMTHLEAEEYFDFNVIGAYVGEHTPAFLYRFTDEEES